MTRNKLDHQMLLAALQEFVNCGDSLDDLRSFRSREHEFFSSHFYDLSDYQAVHGMATFFNWFKRLLRRVWKGNDVKGWRLAVLLGIAQPNYTTGLPGGDFEQEATEHAAMASELAAKLADHKGEKPLFRGLVISATPTPSWLTSEMNYEFQTEFQEAVYRLMGQSWRAKVCPIDGKYFIAAKPPNLYCSPKCTAEAKRKRSLQWWRMEGSKQRQRARKNR